MIRLVFSASPITAEEDCLVGAMAFSCEGEGTVEMSFHPCGLREQVRFPQFLNEPESGPHGADGVRTARADADGEDVENRETHRDEGAIRGISGSMNEAPA